MPYLIYAALAWLGSKLINVLFFIGTSFIAKGLITALISMGIAYFAVTKLEAFNLISGYLTQYLDSSGSSVGGVSIHFDALGNLIELLRIEDIIYVYLSAYITAYLIKLLLKALSVAKVTLPA